MSSDKEAYEEDRLEFLAAAKALELGYIQACYNYKVRIDSGADAKL
jgi:hypothetical protein